MGESSRFTVFHFLFLLILLLGISVRLQDLGAAPLSESEARLALQARALVAGREAAEPGVNAGYTALTGLLFFLFGDTDFIARLVPALAGSLLVLAPWILRDRFGAPVTLVLGAGLALDPVLVGVSRLADGPMFTAGMLSLVAALRIAKSGGADPARRRIWTGFLAALALLSGPAIWLALLILLITWGLARMVSLQTEDREPISYRSPEGVSFGLTLLLAGTLFLRIPEGLGAFAGSIGAFLSGFTPAAPVPALRLLIALAGYHGLVLLFAAIHSWRMRSSADPALRLAWIFMIVAFSILVFYPGRGAADLVWVILPLWVPAAREIASIFKTRASPAYRPAVLALILVVLAASFWVNLASFSNAFLQDPNLMLRVMVLVGTIVLAGLSILLVWMGWEPDSARTGTASALVLLMVFGLINGMFGSGTLANQERRELWQPSPIAGETGMLADTLEELGYWSLGNAVALDVVLHSDSPSIEWVLRRFPNVTRTAALSREDLPSVVITDSENQNFRFASAYRGQGLTWQVHIPWDQMTGHDWLRWMLFKQAPAVTEQIIVWARADLFPTGDEVVLEEIFPEDAAEQEPEEFIPLEDPEDIFPDG